MERFRFDKETIKKMGWKEWAKNFLFYYKWATLIIVCAVILTVALVTSILNQPRPDVSVFLVCRSNTASALPTDFIQAKLADYAGDFDGKHGINARFDYAALPLVSEEENDLQGLESKVATTQEDQNEIRGYLASLTMISSEMDSNTVVYILDEDQYKAMLDNTGVNIYLNLKERYPDLPIVDDVKLMVQDTVFADAFVAAGDELFFVLRDIQYMRDGDKQKNIDYYNHQLAFFDALVAAER